MTDHQHSVYNLVDTLQACSQEQFAGCLDIQETSGRVWSLLFFLGRIVADSGGVQFQRRWQRQLEQYCPQLGAADLQMLVSAGQDWSHFRLLSRWIRQNKISREQAVAVVEGSLKEFLFDLMQREAALCLHPSESLRYATSPNHEVDAAVVPVRVSYILQQVKGMGEQWYNAGLADWSPNMAPVINDLKHLQRTTTPAVYKRLSTLIDGQTSLRDLAVKLQQSPLAVAESLKPYLNNSIISFISLPDPSTSAVVEPPTTRVVEQRVQTQVAAAQGKGSRVVYVDDSPMDGNLMRQVVTKLGCRFHHLQDPLLALPFLIEHKPDLIFLDLVMPVANGYEICAQIRRISQLRDVPVVIVTSNDGVIDRVRARMVGSSGYVTKPIQADVIASILTRYGLIEGEMGELSYQLRAI